MSGQSSLRSRRMSALDIVCIVALAFLVGVVVGTPDKKKYFN